MAEIKRVVIEDYPAGNLPEDVRGGIDPEHRVRVTVEDDHDAPTPRYKRFQGIAAEKNTSIDEAVTRIRTLRDEWT